MTALINAAHEFNNEITDVNGHIKDQDNALRIIHDLPPMHTLQTILLETAPSSDNSKWNLQDLGLGVTTAEDRAHAAGLKLGTTATVIARS